MSVVVAVPFSDTKSWKRDRGKREPERAVTEESRGPKRITNTHLPDATDKQEQTGVKHETTDDHLVLMDPLGACVIKTQRHRSEAKASKPHGSRVTEVMCGSRQVPLRLESTPKSVLQLQS